MRCFYISRFVRYILRTRRSYVKVTCKNWNISCHLLRYIAQSYKIVLQFRGQKYHSCGLSASDIIRTKLNSSICYIHTTWYTLAFCYTFYAKICLANIFWHKISIFFTSYKINVFEHILSMWLKLFYDKFDFILLMY